MMAIITYTKVWEPSSEWSNRGALLLVLDVALHRPIYMA